MDTFIQFSNVPMLRLKWNKTGVEGSTISATTLPYTQLLGVCIRSVWLVRILMTFELICDMSALLFVGVTHSFGMVGHVQQSVRGMAKAYGDTGSERGFQHLTEQEDMVIS